MSSRPRKNPQVNSHVAKETGFILPPLVERLSNVREGFAAKNKPGKEKKDATLPTNGASAQNHALTGAQTIYYDQHCDPHETKQGTKKLPSDLPRLGNIIEIKASGFLIETASKKKTYNFEPREFSPRRFSLGCSAHPMPKEIESKKKKGDTHEIKKSADRRSIS
jgi:hypothetical protein